MEWTIRKPEDMQEPAKWLIDNKTTKVVGLYGNLGSGKTTFTQALARELGVKENVTSPTFVIQKRYKLSGGEIKTLVHIDAYRLNSAEELKVIGWDELLKEENTLIVIEWPERVEGIMPEHTALNFSLVDDKTRKIILK
jgi:tRNA threonylcarbamoyladenosine biosynthesis protein TsaE